MGGQITGNGTHFVIANSLDGPKVIAANVSMAQARGIAETSRRDVNFAGYRVAIYETDQHIDGDLLRTVVRHDGTYHCSGERDPRMEVRNKELESGNAVFLVRSIPEELC